jgi:tRNA-Thr(GGU) m(6)t(6)A37 methyltransferase TsaA
MITFAPIGVVHNDVNKMSVGNYAQAESRIELNADLAAGLQGLAEFSHVVVVFHLDRIPPFDKDKQLLRNPRGMEHLDPVGVFAQRTKFRPNPIGVTPVRLMSIQGNVLIVAGLDAMDGTPVLDVKPYIPEFDCVKNVDSVKMPDWVATMVQGYF